MIFIPIAAIVVMAVFIIVYSKTFLVYTNKWFKLLTLILFLVNLFFIYWGPHINKINSGIVYMEDVWYIIAWAVASIIVMGSVLATKSNQIR